HRARYENSDGSSGNQGARRGNQQIGRRPCAFGISRSGGMVGAQENLRIIGMSRRSLPELPMSKTAAWAARFAFFSLAVAALSIVIVRSQLLEIVPALATFGAALVLAGLAILLAFAAFVVIWRQGYAGLGRALLALFIGIALLAYPAYLGVRAA